MPVDVGSGGEDDVSVVASRVGLNLLDVAFWDSVEGYIKMDTKVTGELTVRCLIRP